MLRRESEQKKQNLKEEREAEYLVRRFFNPFSRFNRIARKTLNDHEIYIHFSNMERTIQMIEQKYYGVQEFILNKNVESNFEAVKNKVLKLQWEYKKILQEFLKSLKFNKVNKIPIF